MSKQVIVGCLCFLFLILCGCNDVREDGDPLLDGDLELDDETVPDGDVETDSPRENPHPCSLDEDLSETADADIIIAAGLCHLSYGRTDTALAHFEMALERRHGDSNAAFLAGFSELLVVMDELYTALFETSLVPEASFVSFQNKLINHFAGEDSEGLPSETSRLNRIAKRFDLAAADNSFRMNLDGFVLRLRALPVYMDQYEFDQADGFLLSGVARLLEGLISFIAAYNMEIPSSYILNEGEPIYTIFNLDIDAALEDPDYPDFLKLRRIGDRKIGAFWLQHSKKMILDSLEMLREAISHTMTEMDNQSIPDLPDHPDFLSQDFLALDGTIFIPGIFGPAPSTACLAMLTHGTVEELSKAVQDVFPECPATFPEAISHILILLENSLQGETLDIGEISIHLDGFFDASQALRDTYPIYKALLEALGLFGGDLGPWSGGETGIPNRTDEDKLPWEHPELYEPVPDREALEQDAARGIDGPAGEFHVGNGYLLASLTREGRLKNLYFPGTTSYNLVPYLTRVTHPYLETEPIPYMGANEEHGSFAGIRLDGELEWLMDRLDYRHINPTQVEDRAVLPSYPAPGIPIVEVQYRDPEGKLDVLETTYSPPSGPASQTAAVVRRFKITNVSEETLAPEFVYYGAFNITDIDQYVLGGKFTINWLLSSNKVEPSGEDAIVWTGPGWGQHPDGRYSALHLTGEADTAMLARGIGNLDGAEDRGAFDQALSGQASEEPVYDTLFGNAYLSWELGTIPAGESREISVVIALGAGDSPDEAAKAADEQADRLLAKGLEDSYHMTALTWDQWLTDLAIPDQSMSRLEGEVYRLAAMALKLSQSAMTGALPEMFDMQPMWYMVWPGSAVWQASALDAMGLHREAEHFFDYVASIQEPDGHWRMAYTTLGDYHGAFEMEYYMTPSLVWFAWMHWQLTGDSSWLRRVWPTVQKAADFVLGRRSENGLLYASPDYVEDMTAFRQSLYTNSIGIAGLICGAEMAEVLGDPVLATDYRLAADALYQAVLDILWNESDGTFWQFHNMHGVHGSGGQTVLTWPYHVFEASDSRIESMMEEYLDPRVDRQDFVTFKDSADWTPGLMMWTTFYIHHYQSTGRQDSLDYAEFLLDGMLSHRTLAGFIPERYFGYGVTGSGKPLLWPHAAYILSQLALAQGKSPIPLAPAMETLISHAE